MLRKIRIFAATFCFVLITLLFHGYDSRLVRMVGKDTVLACVVGFECRCCGRVGNLDSFIGACILLRYLPFRGIARYYFVVC